MRTIKPTKMALLQRTLSIGDKHKHITSPVVFFSLSSGEILTENVQWQKVAASLGSEALDISFPKSTGEFLVAGTAYPEDNKQHCMQVFASVGKVQKSLNIMGERQWAGSWLLGYDIEVQSPVEATPLTWENAYGGPKFKMNPLGTGYTRETALPKIENPQNTIGKPKQKNAPDSFLPMPIYWPQRTKYHGNYKNKWFEQYFPGFAPDTDPKLFDAAPEDQKNTTYWQGDECFHLSGMRADGKPINGQLPAIRPRCFVIADEQFNEVDLVLDTVFLFADHDLGALIYRGKVEVEDSESRNISDVVLGFENTRDAPLSIEHYQSVHQLRIDPKTAPAHALNDAQLTPVLSQEAKQARQHKLNEQQAKKRQALKKQQASQLQTMPEAIQVPLAELPEPELTPFDQLLDEDVQAGNIDLSCVLDEINKQVEKQQQKADDELAKLKQQIGDEPQQSESKVDLATALENYNCLLVPEELVEYSLSLSDDERQQLSEQSLKLKQMNVHANTDYADGVSEALVACLTDDLKCNVPIIGKDLSGLCLNGQVFEGIDFTQTLFAHVKLTRCVFKQCQFQQSAFDYAKLDGCHFEDCNLNQANFGNSQLADTQFVDCQLRASQWLAATANNVNFERAAINDAMFRNCNFYNHQFTQSNIHKALFFECFVSDADFSRCDFLQTTFLDCNLSVSRWNACTMLRTVYQGCDLCLSSFIDCNAAKLVYSINSMMVRSNFINTRLEQSNLRTADAKGIRLIGSTLNSCDIALSDLSHAHIVNANLARSIFADVTFDNAQLIDSICYQARFRNARFNQCKLLKLNVMDADFTNAQFENSEFNQCINLSKVALRDQKHRRLQKEAA